MYYQQSIICEKEVLPRRTIKTERQRWDDAQIDAPQKNVSASVLEKYSDWH